MCEQYEVVVKYIPEHDLIIDRQAAKRCIGSIVGIVGCVYSRRHGVSRLGPSAEQEAFLEPACSVAAASGLGRTLLVLLYPVRLAYSHLGSSLPHAPCIYSNLGASLPRATCVQLDR